MDSFLNNMNSILDGHAPLKKVNKYKLKFKTKPTILKQSKTNYCNHHFETNWNSIKNTWKGIHLKRILNIKNISADMPKSLTVDGTPTSIANRAKGNISFHISIFQVFS